MTRLLDKHEVRHLTGRSASTIYRAELRGEFPSRLVLPTGVVRWREDEVSEWIDSLPRAHDNLAGGR